MSAQVRRLRPIAIICGLVLLAWGICSAVALVARLLDLHDSGWQPLSTWEGKTQFLVVAASIMGCFAILWGALGLVWRRPLHAGALTVLISVGLEVAAMVVNHVNAHISYGHILQAYWDSGLGRIYRPGVPDWQMIAPPWPLLTAVLPLLCWLVVLGTGAGRPRPAATLVPVTGLAAATSGGRYGDRPASSPIDPATGAWAPEPTPQEQPAEAEPVGEEPVEEQAVEEQAVDEQAVQALPVHEPARDEAPAVPRPSDDAAVWFVTVQGSDHGPYTRNQLRGYLAEGRLHEGTITHLAGGEDQALADVLA